MRIIDVLAEFPTPPPDVLLVTCPHYNAGASDSSQLRKYHVTTDKTAVIAIPTRVRCPCFSIQPIQSQLVVSVDSDVGCAGIAVLPSQEYPSILSVFVTMCVPPSLRCLRFHFYTTAKEFLVKFCFVDINSGGAVSIWSSTPAPPDSLLTVASWLPKEVDDPLPLDDHHGHERDDDHYPNDL